VLSDLSGGLDSSTVTALAALGARRDRLIAFTSVSDDVATCDEASFQDDFLARYPLERETVDLTRVLPFGALRPDVAVHPGGGIFSGAELEALTAITDRLGARVWLCGLGGDQLFWGPGLPPLYLADELRRRPLPWLRQAAGFALAGDWHVRDLLRWSVGRPDARFASQPMPHWLRPRFRDAVGEYLAERDRPTGLVDDAGTDLQLRFLTLGVNAASMRPLACEVRYPLLYRPLVEWTLATPWSIRMRAGETRSLQRRALRDVLPPSIARRES
jgi:asparagine synthetase B (glutamine-hydrolysing)